MKTLEQLSAKFGLAGRAMSLVAVVERKSDKLGQVPRTTVVPVGLPQDTAFERYFTRKGVKCARMFSLPDDVF